MDTENRIERTVGLVMLAVLAVGCVLVLRPFFTAVCFALILVGLWMTGSRRPCSSASCYPGRAARNGLSGQDRIL